MNKVLFFSSASGIRSKARYSRPIPEREKSASYYTHTMESRMVGVVLLVCAFVHAFCTNPAQVKLEKKTLYYSSATTTPKPAHSQTSSET